MDGAHPNKTRKWLGMISTNLIVIGPPGMIGAKPLHDPEEVEIDMYMPYQDRNAWNDRCKP